MEENNSIFFQCKILNVEDPMMLGRVRGVRLIDNEIDILKGITDPPWDPAKDIWTVRDPFCFVPLLPYFLYQVPKVDELVQVMYLNKDYKFINQYYVQNNFYSPTSSNFQFFQGGNKFTGTGNQIKDPKPLKNQDGTLTAQEIHKGVFPEPGDNALLGRGSADLIVKQDEILLRAGKFKSETLQPNVLPVANQQNAVLQLSRFPSNKQKLPNKTIYEIKEQVVAVHYLIEWVVTNPENTQNKFGGAIYLYQLKPDQSTNSKNLTVGTEVSDNFKKLIATQPFELLSIAETIYFINDFIKTCNTKNSTASGIKLFNDSSTKFPMFYRPNNLMYTKLSNSTPDEMKNLSEIYKGIKLNPAITGGYGLIYAKNKTGTPFSTEKKIIAQSKYIPSPITYGTLGADKVFLLSNNSAIPGKGKINFADTLYGISVDQFAEQILPKTSSMVRGEELLELINMIVRFLITHTHAYPGLPPISITQDGSSSQKILTELQNAVNKILNEDIRLN